MKISIIEPGGLNIELAILFAKQHHEVFYYSEFHEAFPLGQREKVGSGFPGVTRCTNLNDCLSSGDIIVCPDTHSRQYLNLAQRFGKSTWGAGKAEVLEQDRLFCKKMFKQLGLPVGPYDDGIGITDLQELLTIKENLFIKFPGWLRGAGETRHHYDWKKTQTEWWGHLLSDLGPLMYEVPWIAEEPIEHVMEVAVDQLISNGDFSMPSLVGIEEKDSAYIGKVMTEIPIPLQPGNNKLQHFLETCRAKTFISLETMLTKEGKAIITDPCLRTGHPVSAAQLKLYSNLCNWIIEAATSNIYPLKIKPTHSYAIALEVKSDALDDSWIEVQFKEKFRDRVFLQNSMKRGDSYFVIPKSFIAATIVGVGDSISEARKQIEEVLDSFSCQGMFYNLKSIDNIEETMKKGKENGINF